MEKQVQQHEDEQNHLQQHKADQKQVQVQQPVEDERQEVEQQQHVEDVQLTNPNPNSPPNTHSPPPEPHHSPKPKSPPQQQDKEEDQNADDKQPPSKPATPPPAKALVPPPAAPQLDVELDASSRGRRHSRPSLSILKRSKRESMLRRALVGFRVCGFLFSLISFSILAADKDRGWALDSFYRYKEFRYSLAVNVIAFLYSGFQAFDLVYQLTTGKRKLKNHLRCYFDFSMDQILTYLLMSASSSAAVRIDDWQSNWGKDEFPDMAKASVGLSFLAFLSLGLSSLISGYNLCSLKSM